MMYVKGIKPEKFDKMEEYVSELNYWELIGLIELCTTELKEVEELQE